MEKKRKDLFEIEGMDAVVTRLYRAEKEDFEEIGMLYDTMRGRQFCTWDEGYPSGELLLADIEKGKLYVVKNSNSVIVAAVSICHDADIDKLPCWMGETEKAISFMRLVVAAPYQNQGIARLVLSLAMNQVKRHGVTSVRFLVGKNNVPALCSYRKLQFDEVGEADLFGEEWLCFEKQLLTPGELQKWQEKQELRRKQNEEKQQEKDRLKAAQLCEDEGYMKQALLQAKKAAAIGEVPIGCVIVQDGKIIGRGYNRRNTDKSTLSHAEITAIKKASRALDDWRLEDCTLYVTLEPCQMCAGAIVQARMKRVVIGAMNPKAGCAGSVLNILDQKEFNHQVETTYGVCEKECSRILKDFFMNLRKSDN